MTCATSMADRAVFGAGRMRGLAGAAVLGLAACQLVACATPYKEMGVGGGVREVQITSDIAQVTARGTALTDPDKIEQYVLRKAAETTLAAGYDNFEIISSADRSHTIQGIAGYSAAGMSGLPTAGVNLPFTRPGETVLIRMSFANASAGGATVFNAREVIAHLAAKHRR
jgi:transposase InsO family protein